MNTRANSNPASLFYAGGLSLRLLRAGLALLQGPAPGLSARLAFGLFSTPLPLKWGQRKPLPAPWVAQPWELMGQRLCAWRHAAAASEPARPRVLLVHGWGGGAAQMRALAEQLWLGGLDPILLDMPAHGYSAGWRTHMPQFLQTLHAAAQHFGPLHGAAAHSIGALALSHSSARGLPVQRLALIACSAPPRQVLGWFGHAFGLREAVLQRLRARLVQLGGTGLETFEPAWLGAHLQQPTLLVHDRDDRAAPLKQAQALHQALPIAQLQVTSGLGHRRILRDAAVAQAVRRHLQPAV